MNGTAGMERTAAEWAQVDSLHAYWRARSEGPDPQYKIDYQRGWTASCRAANSTLDRADSRGEPRAWYDGYLDRAAGRPKWHTLHCPDDACDA